MEITNHALPNRHITLVKGLVSEQAFAAIRQALATAPPHSDKQLWIDCTHVDRTHLTNSSICSYVNELLKLKKQEVKVVISGMDATTERLFRLLNLDTLFFKARSADEIGLQAKEPVVA